MTVLIGDAPAQITDVSPSDTLPGMWRVTVQLPNGAADGAAAVLAVGDASSPAGVVGIATIVPNETP